MQQDDGKSGPRRSGFSRHSGLSRPSELSGPFCLYPPQVLDQVDVTEQTEGGTARYVVRNRANSRYFLLKPTEFQVFSRIDGTRLLGQIAAPENGIGPRASRQAVVKFLGKLDSLGLLARGGPAAATRADTGLYPRFSLVNPDRLLGWLDRLIGRVLCRPMIPASFVIMSVSALGPAGPATEASRVPSY